ncbi:MAG: endolytic transglycosylase MltG [Gemmatimonadales bacterium]
MNRANRPDKAYRAIGAIRYPYALSALSALACTQPAPTAPQEILTIPSGATVRVVADSLAAHGIIRSPLWFRILTRARGEDRKLQQGVYAFRRGDGSLTALRALVSGRALLQRFTVPEGFTLLDIAEAAEAGLGIPRDSFLAAAGDPALLREFGIPGPSFEGFLQPETYLVSLGISAAKMVRVMAATFADRWRPEWNALARERRLDRRAVVILASIVETEAKVEQDRSLIAGVYQNRLRLGMPLQADATVQYAIQLATGERKPRLFEKDYRFPSQYNTYLHPGLPPGPVGSPGRKSIEAVLRPAPVQFLYFVARPDGSHIFSRTYAEHLRAVRRARSLKGS